MGQLSETLYLLRFSLNDQQVKIRTLTAKKHNFLPKRPAPDSVNENREVHNQPQTRNFSKWY